MRALLQMFRGMLPEPLRQRAIRVVLRSPRLTRLVAVARHATLVRRQAAFFWNEVAVGSGLEAYDLHRQRGTIVIRHGTSDLHILQEIFGDELYEPPAAVTERLAGRSGGLEILDLGGHIGLFGLWALQRFPGCRVRSFEPDPGNWRVLERTHRANGSTASWRQEQSCVGNRAGSVSFAAGRGAASHVTTGAGLQRPLCDVFEYLGDADLVKMDIEGGEWPILADPRLARNPPTALVLECHPRQPGDLGYDAAARELLGRAGYEVAAITPCPPGVAMLWAWQPRRSVDTSTAGQLV